MGISDRDNLYLATNSESVDRTNSRFYSRFPYPWRPKSFSFVEDPDLETKMLNQSIGDWWHKAIPENPNIWIAGCGTNQAIYTALKFPKAKVLGSDISTKSLSLCSETAKQLNITNLELKEENINSIDYEENFDYILSTGVIHCNFNPEATLKKLCRALKPSGIIELMVYNQYHMLPHTAFQKAVRIMAGNIKNENIDFDKELLLGKNLVQRFPENNSMSSLLDNFRDCDESMFADELLQPVQYNYTIESLQEIALNSGLELDMPCINQFDKATKTYSWNINFNHKDLQEPYNSLPDIERWNVSNLLKYENSPHLWFYLKKLDSNRARKSEKDICIEFLNQKFKRNNTTLRVYLEKEGEYKLSDTTREHPSLPRNELEKNIITMSDGTRVMKDIFEELDISTDFITVNEHRLRLTTTAYPYLCSVSEDN